MSGTPVPITHRGSIVQCSLKAVLPSNVSGDAEQAHVLLAQVAVIREDYTDQHMEDDLGHVRHGLH
jgi:hypothetical protein